MDASNLLEIIKVKCFLTKKIFLKHTSSVMENVWTDKINQYN